MANLTKAQFDTLYNSAGSGTFLDNSVQAIVEGSMRAFAKDIEDSFFNLNDNKYSGAAGVYLNITDTTGLKAVTTIGVSVGFLIFYRDSSGNLNSYQLVSGTDAESLPSVVRPTDYDGATNQKIWKIASTTSGVTISNGTYTPTISNTTNVSASSANAARWIRIGNVVSVSGTLSITPTAAAPTNTSFEITLPVSTSLTNGANDLAGSGSNGLGQGCYVRGSGSGARAAISYPATITSATGMSYIFSYLID